jgi:hypothetical protein
MAAPILQKHGERRRSTALLRLLHKRHVEPYARAFLGRGWKGASQENGKLNGERDTPDSRRAISPDPKLLTDRERDDENGNDNQNDPQ